MKTKLTILFSVIAYCLKAQNIAIQPTILPSLFKSDYEITVTYDVTGTPLANLTNAYLWIWIPGKNIDAKYNINPATSAADPAKLTKSVLNGRTTFSITFIPADFFTGDVSAETQLGMLLKGPDWSNGQTTDFVSSFWDGSFQIKLTSPTQNPLFLETGEMMEVSAETPLVADFDLFINEVLVEEQNTTKNFSYEHTATETSGTVEVKLVATIDGATAETHFSYLIRGSSPTVAKPVGIISGINYHPEDNTKVTLCLLAPGKSSVYVRGDFSNWNVTTENLMKKDGEYFWIEISELNPGQEYAYQYIVDETLFLADPFADKILDPDDQYIPEATYPDLKQFPADGVSDKWYNNRVAVFQTGQQPYNWQTLNYTLPATEDLVIYELHIRDFFADGSRNYQSLIDTISYFKRLGVNAIELMPIMEFNGNDSWGYNPTFMFAPDKYYGTKNKLKEFIDRCHENGIAVILDIVLNQQDLPSPFAMLDFDFDASRPEADNRWFNVTATHPFNVFYDMNHESAYTKAFVDTVNHYWLHEFKVDGFRFDLSKGFTQTNNPDNVNAWSAKDDSRIAILKRMADEIRSHSPNAILILEHLSDNVEEKILADYGFLLWGNMNHAFAENTMGYAPDSDISWASHKQRGWSSPHLIAYMESHDEERQMFKNLSFGNSSGAYSVKNLDTAIERSKAASTFYLAIPGPKMIWQFGELGYDVSIDFNGRTGQKPVKWEYYDDPARKGLFNHFADMIALKKAYKIFETEDFTIQGGATLTKQLTLKNSPYTDTPSSAEEMNVHVAVNFDVVTKSMSLNFPHTGKWYDYISGEEINVQSTPLNVAFLAGEYALYTDVKLKEGEEPVTNAEDDVTVTHAAIYPNPSKDLISINSRHEVTQIILTTPEGFEVHPEKVAANSWRISTLAAGLYIVNAKTKKGVLRLKLIKQN